MGRYSYTFKQEIEEAAGGQPIEGIVIGPKGWDGSTGEAPVRPWKEAADELDYEYNDGFGSLGCHAIYAWTATRVLLVREYDGASSVTWVPRHPIPCEPETVGG